MASVERASQKFGRMNVIFIKYLQSQAPTDSAGFPIWDEK
jgi:hypothetical protein